MRSSAGPLLALFFMLISATQVSAEEPTITMQAEPAQATIGKRIDITISYQWTNDWEPQSNPDPSQALQTMDLTRLNGPHRTTTGEMTEVSWTATTLVERSGSWALPRPQLSFVHRDGTIVTAQAPEVFISATADGSPAALASPRGVWQPPRELTNEGPAWWLISIPVLGALALVAVLIIKRLRSPHRQPDPAQVFSNDVAAARRLDDGRQVGIALSAALRRYCGARHHFDGVAATGPETVAHLGAGVPGAARSELRRLCEQLDGLLWAPAALASASVLPLIDHAVAWVEREEQRFAEQAAEAAASQGNTHPTSKHGGQAA